MPNSPQTIGESRLRIDAPAKCTGDTRFLDDLRFEGLAWAAPVVSSTPFGRILAVDGAHCESLPGFLDLVLARHVPGENQVGVICNDQPLLAQETVRYVGDTIALAVAADEATARRAAELVQIKYEEFDPVLSIEQSRAARSDYLHASNVACRHRLRRGEIAKGLRLADLVVEAEFRTPCQEHFYLEGQGCVVLPGEDGALTIHGSLQCPFYVQKAVARAMGLPFAAVRVIQAPTGGGFGGKEDLPSELCARAAVAAARIGRPVKLVYRRREDVQLTSKRHPFLMSYRVGVTRDGRLTAAEIRLDHGAGAYATLSSVVSYRAAVQAAGPYVIPNVKVDSTSWYTNLPPNGAFRGFGSPQATFGHERMMDHVAEELGMDPLELRLRNVLRPGDRTPTGQLLEHSVGAERCLKEAARAAGWGLSAEGAQSGSSGKRVTASRSKGGTGGGSSVPAAEGAEETGRRYLRGRGLALCHYGNCLGAAGWFLDGAGARIRIHRDGSISAAFGLVEMGQGALTAVAQMAAKALGVSTERVLVEPTDTQQVPDSGPAVASRNVVMTGNALRDAADKLIPVIQAAAAELLECAPGDVELAGDRACVRGGGEAGSPDGGAVSLSFEELAEHLFLSNRPMAALGWWHVPPLSYDAKSGLGEAYFSYSYAAHMAEVSVDTLTGRVRVERIWAAHDVGRAINPAGIEGQVEGGTAQGVGWALSENYLEEGGRVITNNFSTYLVPTTTDLPEVETIQVEEPEPLGPWGAKGIGEPAIIPTAAAVANAVSRALGVQVDHIPILPEEVLNLLETAASTESRTG